MATVTRWPLPVCVRWSSAARMPATRWIPVPESPICAPVAVGGPSSNPVVLIAPPIAWATTSYALKFSYLPGPKPLIDANTRPGLSSWSRSQVKPIRSIAPGAKFSTRTSEFFTRSMKISLPRSDFMFSVMLRLLQFSIVKYRLSTSGRSRSCWRVMSPVGASSLITSAPSQARIWVQDGPDCTWVMSRTRTPSRALVMTGPLYLYMVWFMVPGA